MVESLSPLFGPSSPYDRDYCGLC